MGFFSRLLGRKKDGVSEQAEVSSGEVLQGGQGEQGEEEVVASLEKNEDARGFAAEDVLRNGDSAPASLKEESPPKEELPSKEGQSSKEEPSPEEGVTLPQEQESFSDSNNEAEEAFVLALNEVERTPGHWLAVVLEGEAEASPVFWRRMELLFEFLDTPAEEAKIFCAELEEWLSGMGLYKVDDFRSELQYRLAVALDMEDEPEERERFLTKLWRGLAKTRAAISGSLGALFSGSGELNNAFWEELEEILISSDVGFEATAGIVEDLKKMSKKSGCKTRLEARELLQQELCKVFDLPLPEKVQAKPEVVLVVGVNGAGKTTTIAKMAYRDHLAGKKVLVAAADTFRAAAIEQLEVWAKRIGAGFYSKTQGADPAAVAFEALAMALSEGYDTIYIDTAGRLQTKANLMEELGKINRVLGKKMEGAPHRSILVLDGTTGQNALSQAKLFSESSPISEIVISKLDGTSRAGVAVGVAMNQKIPITFIGLGEKMEDLRPFDGAAFVHALLEE